MSGVLRIFDEDPIAFMDAFRKRFVMSLDVTEEEISADIERRRIAQSQKDYVASDMMRDLLKSRRIILKDTQDGTHWDIDL